MKFNKTKRLFCTLLVMLIVNNFFIGMAMKSIAYAEAVPPLPEETWKFIPQVIEGGLGSGGAAAASGLSVGGILAVIIGAVAVGYGTYLVVDNWDDITNAYALTLQVLNDTDPLSKEAKLWKSIYDQALYINDPSITLYDYINTNGIENTNFWEFYVPATGQMYSTQPFDYEQRIIDINEDVAESTKSFIEGYHGWTELKPGLAGDLNSEVNALFTAYNCMDAWQQSIETDGNFLSYGNICIVSNDNSLLQVFAGNSPFTLGTYQYGVSPNYYFKLRLLQNYPTYVYSYRNNQYLGIQKNINMSGIQYILGNVTKNDKTLFTANDVSGIKLNNMPLPFLDGQTTIFTYPASINEYTILPSQYKWRDITDEYQAWKAQRITVNTPLINELENISAADVTNTDDIAEALVRADQQAVALGETPVLSEPIEPSGAELPSTAHDPTWFSGLFSGLLKVLKEFANWLFVPSQASISEFISHCEDTMNAQAGILTYPLTLVIQFLGQVLDLQSTDCILTIPRIEIFGHVLYEGMSWNFSQEVRKSDYAMLYSTYLVVTDFIMIIAVLNLAAKKGDEIIRGN